VSENSPKEKNRLGRKNGASAGKPRGWEKRCSDERGGTGAPGGPSSVCSKQLKDWGGHATTLGLARGDPILMKLSSLDYQEQR